MLQSQAAMLLSTPSRFPRPQVPRHPIIPSRACSLNMLQCLDTTHGTQCPVPQCRTLMGHRLGIMDKRVTWVLHLGAREIWRAVVMAAMNMATTLTNKLLTRAHLLIHAARHRQVRQHGQAIIILSGVIHFHIRRSYIRPRHQVLQTVIQLLVPPPRATRTRAQLDRQGNECAMKTMRP